MTDVPSMSVSHSSKDLRDKLCEGVGACDLSFNCMLHASPLETVHNCQD